MDEKFVSAWENQFPEEPFPTILCNRSNPHELIGIYDCKIHELQKSLEQCSFIKQYLIEKIKLGNNSIPCNKISQSTTAPKVKPKTFDKTSKSFQGAKPQVEINGSVNKFINQYKTVVVHASPPSENHGNFTDIDRNKVVPSQILLNRKQHDKITNRNHVGTLKSSDPDKKQNDDVFPKQPMADLIRPTNKAKGDIHHRRCVSLVDVSNGISRVVRGRSYDLNRECSLSHHASLNSPKGFDSSSDVKSINKIRSKFNRMSQDMTGESFEHCSNNGTRNQSARPVPAPRRNRSPEINSNNSDFYIRTRQVRSDNNINISGANIAVTVLPKPRDMAVECTELPSVHSRIHNFENQLIDNNSDILYAIDTDSGLRNSRKHHSDPNPHVKESFKDYSSLRNEADDDEHTSFKSKDSLNNNFNYSDNVKTFNIKDASGFDSESGSCIDTCNFSDHNENTENIKDGNRLSNTSCTLSDNEDAKQYNSSEVELSGLEEVNLDGKSLTSVLTASDNSVEKVDMRNRFISLSNTKYDSIDFDCEEPDIDALNITDDEKTKALDIDLNSESEEKPSEIKPYSNKSSNEDVFIESEYETLNNNKLLDDTQKCDLVLPGCIASESPSSEPSYRSHRRRHDYEEIKEFIIPIIDPPNEMDNDKIPHQSQTGGTKPGYRKRIAPKPDVKLQVPHHISPEGESSDSEETEHSAATPEEKTLHQRYVVIKGILDSEEAYLSCLDVIVQYMKSLEGASKSSLSQLDHRQSLLWNDSPYIGNDQVQEIFYNIEKIYEVHREFVTSLRERVRNWTPQQIVGDLFKILISRFPIFTDYIKHYQKSVDTINQCSLVNPAFGKLVESIKVPTVHEPLSLQEILFKPVQRIQRNTLVLHDLIRCTPSDHRDYVQLEKTLKLSRHSLGEFELRPDSSNQDAENRRLIHYGFAVEQVDGLRKLRFIFLFNDVIVCAKRKLNARHKCTFEIKWFVPLFQLSIDKQFDSESSNQGLANVEDLKKRVSQMKAEIRRDIKYESGQKKWLNSGQRSIVKQKKKLEMLEADLVLASPNLPFRLTHKGHKSYVLLMSTDYEREEWVEAVTQQMAKCQSQKIPTSLEIHKLIEEVKQLPKVNNIGSVLLNIGSDDDVWKGVLNITVKQLSGLSEPADTYCSLEVDSYGHFFEKAKTKVCPNSTEPVWNEDFDIDLDGSQTLRILCYRVSSPGSPNVVLGRSRLELNKSWLTDRYQEMNVPMNETSLKISLKHTSAARTMKRQLSRLKNGVFGVKISSVTKREQNKVPILITACAEEVERRGLSEVGVYRMSGVTSDVQKLKKSFEKNSRAAAFLLDQYDIHAVTGILKLYLRELPEPLFTTYQYPHFVTTLELKDPEAKERCMISLLQELPDVNLTAIQFLLNHLTKVAKDESVHKMSLNNLATIFGPTLLHPASMDIDPTQSVAQQVLTASHEAYIQTSILLYFLELHTKDKIPKYL